MSYYTIDIANAAYDVVCDMGSTLVDWLYGVHEVNETFVYGYEGGHVHYHFHNDREGNNTIFYTIVDDDWVRRFALGASIKALFITCDGISYEDLTDYHKDM